MTEMHDRVRDLLHDVAEEMPRTAMLPRLDRHAGQARRRHRLLLVAAVVVALVAAVGIASLVREPNRSEPMPAQQPPKMFRIADIETDRPGTAMLAVVASNDTTMQTHEDVPAYVLPAAGGAALTVPGGHPVLPGLQRLSADGTLLLREGSADIVRVLDLRTGREREYVVGYGTVHELSPDNRRVATYIDRGVSVTNLASGRTTTVRTAGAADERGGLGWSPDGQRLALHEPGGTRIVDAHGSTLVRLPDFSLINGSMSWSPSGRDILGYNQELGTFVLASSDGNHRADIDKPTQTAARLMGWTGTQLVWLIGDPGAQQLITTDQHGHHRTVWMRFADGFPSVQTVTWAQALSGSSTVPATALPRHWSDPRTDSS